MNTRDDPYFHAPTMGMIEARAQRDDIPIEDAYILMEREREETINAIQDDPYHAQVEPPIWWVMDALVNFPYCHKRTEGIIKERLGMAWDEFKTAMRKHLGFSAPVRSILVSGANRSSKTHWAVRRAIMLLCQAKPEDEIIFCHEKRERSILHHQTPVFKQLPKEYRKETRQRGLGGWLSFSAHTGFSYISFKLPNKATMRFSYYEQDISSALEGAPPIMVELDETFPENWLKTAERRVAQKNGFVTCTFTPVFGWTTGIQQFLEDSTIVKEQQAYLLPMDGGAVMPWLQMGLTEEEYRELQKAEQEERPARAPYARPQDCLAWLEGKDGMDEAPKDRAFHGVPRVAMCADSSRAIVYLHPCDNPYGNPRLVIEKAVAQGTEMVKRSVYGQVSRIRRNKFPNFDESKNVVPDEAIPAMGINYMFNDPAEARNMFLGWMRSTPEYDYFYREWPGNYHIPGIGVPETWAVPSSRKPETGNDGDRGGAQAGWGFGYFRMKFEIARLEGWMRWQEWKQQGRGPDEIPDAATIQTWLKDDAKDRERIATRYVDCRPASKPKIENELVSTMHDYLNDLGMGYWRLSPGEAIVDGEEMINTALGLGRLRIAESCVNMRFALKNYTGGDGEKGACKDPIDILRWYYTARLAQWWSEVQRKTKDAIQKAGEATPARPMGSQVPFRPGRMMAAPGPKRMCFRSR